MQGQGQRALCLREDVHQLQEQESRRRDRSESVNVRNVPLKWQNQRMRNPFRRPIIAILAATPITALSLFGAGIGSAEPLDCVNGQFWDPITNTCQTPRPAADCAPGEYWNPLSNVCRPLGQL